MQAIKPFDPAYRLLVPDEFPREHKIQRNPGGCLFPVLHHPFHQEEYPGVVDGVFFHRPFKKWQHSFTVALVFTGWKVTGHSDMVVTCTWHLAISPAHEAIAEALDMGAQVVVGEEIKRIAGMLGNFPLILGSCVAMRIGHCGDGLPVVITSCDFLHGVAKIQMQHIEGIKPWWRWTYDLHPRGPMVTPLDLWAGNDKLEIVEQVLGDLGQRLLRRVEVHPHIASAMAASQIPPSPSSGTTVIYSHNAGALRTQKRRMQRGGWTTYEAPNSIADLTALGPVSSSPDIMSVPTGLGKAAKLPPPPPPPGIGTPVTPSSSRPARFDKIPEEGSGPKASPEIQMPGMPPLPQQGDKVVISPRRIPQVRHLANRKPKSKALGSTDLVSVHFEPDEKKD